MPAPATANYMRRWMSVARWVAVFSGVLTAAALVAFVVPRGADGLLIFGILGSIFGATGLLVGVITYFTTRKAAGQIDAILAGQGVLAHWTYTLREWELYAEGEAKRARKAALIVFPILLLPLLFFLYIGFFRAGGATAAPLLIAFGVVAGVSLLVWALIFLPARSLKKRGPGDAYVTPDAVLLGGRLYSWRVMGARLTKVVYEAGDPSVVEFAWIQPGAGARGSSGRMDVRVPVPRGREEEARRLVASFNSNG